MTSIHCSRRKQRGAFAVFAAIALAVLLGAIGLAVDGGRLLTNKSELQSAADACALAAVSELVCDATNASCLSRAAKRGVSLGNRNKKDLQSSDVSITEADVTFSTSINGTFDKSQNAARYAKCAVAPAGITPTFLGMLGIKSMLAKSTAVAGLTGGQSLCVNAPIAVCSGTTLSTGQWLAESYTDKKGTLGSGVFKWALLSGKGGANSIAEALASNDDVCASKGDPVVFPGVASGVSDEYNSHFGLYKSAATDLSASSTSIPDKTGYAYPTASIGVNDTSAYLDYLSKRSSNAAFSVTDYQDQSGGKSFNTNTYKKVATSAELLKYGKDRRILTVIVVDCKASAPAVTDSACVLMLNPMDNGNGNSSTPLYLQYLGKPGSSGTPCQKSGLPDSSGNGIGSTVPALVN